MFIINATHTKSKEEMLIFYELFIKSVYHICFYVKIRLLFNQKGYPTMVDGKSLKEDLAEEKTRLGKMTWAEKKQHIWMYYKIPILAVIFLVILISSVTYMYIMNDYENVFYTVIVDGRMDGISEKKDPLTLGFTEYLGIDGKSERVYFDNNYTLTYTNALDQDPFVSAEKLQTQIATGSIDALITNRNIINGFSKDDETSLLNLSLLLTEEEFKAIEDHIIYYTLKDGTRIPNAVSLAGTKVVDEFGLTVEDPCYGIVISAPHADNGVRFLRYVFDLQ